VYDEFNAGKMRIVQLRKNRVAKVCLAACILAPIIYLLFSYHQGKKFEIASNSGFSALKRQQGTEVGINSN